MSKASVRLVFVAGTALFALAAGVPLARSVDGPQKPPDKVEVAPFDERWAKIVAGLRKLKEPEVVALLGPAQTMKRPVPKELGRPMADRELGWQLDTRITVQYKEGKVSEVSAVFSEGLPVARVTPENFRRVQVGTTQEDVVALLGESYATLTVGGGLGDQWGARYSIALDFDKDGLLVGQRHEGHSYGPRK